jgi:uncharacterized protein (DUF433 family)
MEQRLDRDPSRLLNSGIYDVVDVARLIRRDPNTVTGWTRSSGSRHPLIVPQHGGLLFSFLDLISLYVISELLRRKVSRNEIYRGALFVAARLKSDRPFAHQALATAGTAFFAELDEQDEWLDIGKWGQAPFAEMVVPILRPITYEHSLAARWQPHPLVVVDPRLQAGAPCIEGTRVPTSAVLRYLSSGEDPDEVADDLGLLLDQVRAAREFEQQLDQAA